MIRGKRKEDLLRNSLIKMLSGKIMDVKMVLWETCFEILQTYFSWHHRRDLNKTLISLLSLMFCSKWNSHHISSSLSLRYCYEKSIFTKPFYSVHIYRSNWYILHMPIAHGEVYSIQHYIIKFVSDLQQVCGFLWVLWFLPPMKLTGTK